MMSNQGCAGIIDLSACCHTCRGWLSAAGCLCRAGAPRHHGPSHSHPRGVGRRRGRAWGAGPVSVGVSAGVSEYLSRLSAQWVSGSSKGMCREQGGRVG